MTASGLLGVLVLLASQLVVAPAHADTSVHHRVFANWLVSSMSDGQSGQVFGATSLDHADITAVSMSQKPDGQYPGTGCLIADGQLFCWGNNANGQIGDGTTTNRTGPTFVTGASGLPQGEVTDVVTGYNFTCALAAGRVFCWGLGTAYQLATGDSSLVPVEIGGQLAGKHVDEIAGKDNWADSGYMLARVGSAVYEWGSLHDHSCANPGGGTTYCVTTVSSPALVEGSLAGKSVTRVYMSGGVAAALADGRVYAWGVTATDIGRVLGTSSTQQDITPTVEGAVLDDLDEVALFDGDVLAAVKGGQMVYGDPGPALSGRSVGRVFAARKQGYTWMYVVDADGSLWEKSPNVGAGSFVKSRYSDVVDFSMPGMSDTDHLIAAIVAPGATSAPQVSTSGEDGLALTWTAPTDTGGAPITGYRVRRFVNGAAEAQATIDTGSAGLSFTDAGLTRGQAYAYTVAAQSAGGIGQQSPLSGTGLPGTSSPPAGAIGVTINAGANYTRDKNVSLSIVWPTNAVTIQISNDGGFLPALTKSFSPASNIDWALDDTVRGQYTKIVYIRFLGHGIDQSRTYTDDIIFDNTPPGFTHANYHATDKWLVVSTEASDLESGLSTIEVASDAGTTTAAYASTVQIPTTPLKAAALAPTASAAGTLSSAAVLSFPNLRTRVSDKAGNWSPWTTLVKRATADVRAVSRTGKLRVDVGPDMGSGYWTFKVQYLKSSGKWGTYKKVYKTQGAKETRSLNLKKGTYRIVVRPKFDHQGTVSGEVKLKR